MMWPAFKWSHDDQYFARLGDDCIAVYESSSMKLLKDPKTEKRTSVAPTLTLALALALTLTLALALTLALTLALALALP